jgi:predicted transposase/invertase (TIGR01784 family)
MRTDLLNPKNDCVFKRLLADAPDLLASLINAVRFDRPPIEVVRVLNPGITPRELGGKFIVLDVLAQDARGHRFDVEMQSRRHPAWSARSAFYLARTLTQQLDEGQDYERLRSAVGIHLLDFTLFNDSVQPLWCFELRDRRRPEILLGEELELNLVELPKIRRSDSGSSRSSHPDGLPAALGSWIEFFDHWHEEGVMAQIDEPAVREAMARLQRLSADDETRRAAFVRERALRDERAARREEREAGREEGRSQGLAEGLARGEAALLTRLLVRRFGPLPAKYAERITAADSQTLEHWADRAFEAQDLDAVFRDR